MVWRLPLTRTRGDIAQIKIKMLELYSRDPRISDAEVSRLCRINAKTVKKYRLQLFAQLDGIRAKVTEKEEEVHEETVGLWQKMSKILG